MNDQAAKQNILVVDDDEMARDTISAMLERQGYRVLQADSAAAAIETISLRHIDAFLLDIEMPFANGVDLCREIRAMDQHRMTPVIFVTGLGEGHGLDAAFSAGCDDFVTKPVDGIVLRARLRNHLQRMDYLAQLESSRRTLTQYLSKRTREVVEAASKTGRVLAPKQRDIVILFTDIRGFTALAEEMEPERLFSLLNEQLSNQVSLVYDQGGYIDKFGGDGVMAVFDGRDMVRQSCLCALRIMESARNSAGSGDLKIRQLGIGIHTGRAVCGTIGAPEHLDYSVIGTTVNLAARLCGHAQPMSIVVSKTVRDIACDDARFLFESERRVEIRGLKEPVTVYSLASPAGQSAAQSAESHAAGRK